ncbi:MAG: flagellar export protein FliJ [Rhodocyclales bacterium]|nr:flagellar export protein FliJ [Rhodocyclales bacterium]
MSPHFHLQPLLDLSHLRLDEAARELGKLIAGEQEASQRLSLLVQYREEYHARFLAAAKNGIGPGEWSNYTRFFARIDDAIIPAAQSVTLTQQRTLAGQQHWMGRNGRVKAFNTLADRHRSQLTCQEQRTEQKASDEHGARRHAENSSAITPEIHS